jgi:hypothetical protein
MLERERFAQPSLLVEVLTAEVDDAGAGPGREIGALGYDARAWTGPRLGAGGG